MTSLTFGYEILAHPGQPKVRSLAEYLSLNQETATGVTPLKLLPRTPQATELQFQSCI